MSSYDPRPPYSAEELSKLYPDNLELKQVQVIFRHGERTPVARRLQNAGVPDFWPLCKSASQFRAAVLSQTGDWDHLSFQRRVETFASDGSAALATSPDSSSGEGICLQGELTDLGRTTTLALGQRLRHLYINQLGFLPDVLPDQKNYYLRATPIVRALESLQQVFTGVYPPEKREEGIKPIIHTRSPQEENLFPNEPNCRRFNQLARAFAQLAADTHNNSPEMQYLQEKIGKWMPEGNKVAVDGHPRLSGLADSINSTFVHGNLVKLPAEFYDPEVRRILNDINVDEWFRGYEQSSEYRRLGAGRLLGDIKDRAMGAVAGKEDMKIALMGCHDTTLSAILATLGCFDKKWPPFTSSIAVETFRFKDHRSGIFDALMGKKKEDGWFVRVRYNDKPMVLKGCKKEGKHMEGDESLCTMSAFKEIVEKVTPKDWKAECLMNLDKTGIPPVEPVE